MKFMGDKWTSMVRELSFEGLQKSWRALCFAGLSFQLEGPTLRVVGGVVSWFSWPRTTTAASK